MPVGLSMDVHVPKAVTDALRLRGIDGDRVDCSSALLSAILFVVHCKEVPMGQDHVVTEEVGGEPYQYYPLGEHVVRAIGVCGGRPTFKYTRIEIIGPLQRLAAGETLDEIVAGFGGRVSREAIVEASQIVTAQFLRTLPEIAA